MLKHLLFLFIFLFIFPFYVNADSVDAPYYLGLVTTDGGTIVNDGAWMESSDFGHHRSTLGWSGYWNNDNAQAVRLLNNGAIAILYWWYDSTPGVEKMVLDDSDIFKVTQDHITYYGSYSFGDTESSMFDNPQRMTREWKTGDSFVLTLSLGSVTRKEVITFERKGITAPAYATPGSSIADCALLHFYGYYQSKSDYEISTTLLAPGKGTIMEMNYEFGTDGGVTQIGVDSKDEVTAWGTGSYKDYMAADFTAALSTLNGLTLSTNIVDVKPSNNTKVVVIPLNSN